jgi:hypothetical protein
MNINYSDSVPSSIESDAEAGAEAETPKATASTGRRMRLGDDIRMFTYLQAERSSGSSSAGLSEGASEGLSEGASEPKIEATEMGETPPLSTEAASSASTTSETITIKEESPESDRERVLPPNDNQEPITISADDLEEAFRGAAKVLKYPGPRNPLSKRMRFPSEEPFSSDSEPDDGLPKGKFKKLWDDDWWGEIGEINAGAKGKNHVKDRSEQLGGDKKG